MPFSLPGVYHAPYGDGHPVHDMPRLKKARSLYIAIATDVGL